MTRLFRVMRNPWVAGTLLFAVALLPKLVFLQKIGVVVVGGDQQRYLTTAENIWNHGTYGLTPDKPHSNDPVLYSLFLAPMMGLFGDEPLPALYLQCILSALTAVLAYLIARRIYGDLAGWLAGLFCASYVPMMKAPAKFLNESLAGFLLMLGILLAVQVWYAAAPRKGWWAAAAGGVFALLALTRVETFPLLAIPVTLWLASRWLDRGPERLATRPAVWAVLAATLAFSVTYSPWVIRNQLAFGRPILLNTKSKYLPNSAAVCAHYIRQGYDFHTARELERRDRENGRASSHPPVQRFSATYFLNCGQRFAIILGAHPCLELPFPFAGQQVLAPAPIRWFNYAWSLALIVFAAVGITGMVCRWQIAALLTASIPLGMMSIYALIHAIPRYQAMPFTALTVPAGLGVAWAAEWLLATRFQLRPAARQADLANENLGSPS